MQFPLLSFLGALSVLLVVIGPIIIATTSAFDVVRQQLQSHPSSLRTPLLLRASSSSSSTSQQSSRSSETSSSSSANKSDDASQRRRISSKFLREFSYATVEQARAAWMEHSWRRGGGLPLLVLLSDDDTKRTILPIGITERLVVPGTNDNNNTITYSVENAGIFQMHVDSQSHVGTVQFEERVTSGGSGCRMEWTADFDVQSSPKVRDFYQTVTDTTISIAADTVQEALVTPRLLDVRTQVQLPESKMNDDEDPVNGVCRTWLDFVWGPSGGGLFLPPGFRYGPKINGLPEFSAARTRLLRIPPFLKETVTSVSYRDWQSNSSNNYAEVRYQVNNPGWAAFPFLLHTHAGRVRFRKIASNSGGSNANTVIVAVEWMVEIRPFAWMGPLVELFSTMTVSTLARNFLVHITDPDGTVSIKRPRGGGKPLARVSKDSWLGGVLEAHLSDTRSTWDQTVSLFQPWTWGRSGYGGDGDVVQYTWKDGTMPE